MSQKYRAVILLIIGVSLFGIMDGLGKFLAADFSVLQLSWARFAFAIPVIIATTPPANWRTLLRSKRPALQAVRAVLLIMSSTSALVGLTLMPLADVTAITFAAPLFVVALSAPLLGERVKPAAWISVGLGFVGVLIVVRPGLGSFTWAALFPLAAAFLFGLYQILTRKLSHGDAPATTLAWTVLTGFVIVTPLLPFDWATGGLTSWSLLVLSGLLFGTSHLLLIRAFGLAPASVLTPFTYTQMIAAVTFALVVLGELPDPGTLAGTALIVFAGIFVLRSESRPEGDLNTASLPKMERE